MAMPNVQCSESSSSAILPEKVAIVSEVIMGNGFEHAGCGNGSSGEVAERQARAIISTAKRALEEEEETGGGGADGKMSMKRSLERFLETRRKRMVVAVVAAVAGVHRRGGEYGWSLSCSN
uniref:Uncharacterized protein n=1 Tax=Oryza punctata TaxID=4537 RepID=A0A0E0LEP2_ORYPU